MGKESEKSNEHSSLKLLRAAQQGSPEAAESLYDYYRPVLERWAHGRLPRWARDLVNTQDLVQETMYAALDRVKEFEYRRSGAFQAYLRQGLRNRIRNEIRRVRRRPPADTLGDAEPAEDTSPLEAAVGSETFERYEKALERLKETDREAIVARIEFGLSFAEVADAIGKPSEDAARMAVKRALLRLAQEMVKHK